jgi:hypothetical protein
MLWHRHHILHTGLLSLAGRAPLPGMMGMPPGGGNETPPQPKDLAKSFQQALGPSSALPRPPGMPDNHPLVKGGVYL